MLGKLPVPGRPTNLDYSRAEDSHEKSSLISSKDKSKKLKCRLLQVLFGALRVKHL